MKLKEYYKQVLVNSLIQEEIIKVKPREAALIRQQLGLPPKSTVERLEGSEQTLPMGAGWNTESQGVVDKAAAALSKDDRELKRSVFKGRYRNLPPQEKNYNGLRNFLLHNTRQAPDEVGLSLDAVSPPRIANRSQLPRESAINKEKNIRDHMQSVLQRLGIHDEHPDSFPARVNLYNMAMHFIRHHGIQLEPKHIKGIDFSNPDFKSHFDTIYSRIDL